MLGLGGDDRSGLLVVIFPAVLLLAGDDEYPFTEAGRAIPRNIHGGDIAEPILRGGQQAEIRNVAPFPPARAAGRLAEDHDVPGYRCGHDQPQSNPAFVVGDEELPDGVRAKHDRGGRLP